MKNIKCYSLSTSPSHIYRCGNIQILLLYFNGCHRMWVRPMYDEETQPLPSYFSSSHIRHSKTLPSRLKNALLSQYKRLPRPRKVTPGLGIAAFLLILAFGSAYGLFFRVATSQRSPSYVSSVGSVPRAPGSPSPTAKSQGTPFPALSQVGKMIPAPTPVPTVAPVQQATPTVQPTPERGVNNNPWGYNFDPGQLIYNPPAQFCSYFKCVQNFYSSWAHGYVVECNDSSFSRTGGTQSACARDGGVERTLYAH